MARTVCLVVIVFYQVQCALFYIENDAEIFPTHYIWKVAEKRSQIAFMMNKLAIIISFEIIIEKYCQKLLYYCEIQVRTILVCTLYSIKYSNDSSVNDCVKKYWQLKQARQGAVPCKKTKCKKTKCNNSENCVWDANPKHQNTEWSTTP